MDSSPPQDIYIPEQWSEAAESISCSSTPPIVFICGAKNCGKTTFSRYLLNILLHKYTKVAYLDTDVGQPEFTPPAFLSLTIVHKVTPDLTVPCLKTPERCLFFGDVSCKRDPSTYLSYVFAIYDYYQKEYGISVKEENLCNKVASYCEYSWLVKGSSALGRLEEFLSTETGGPWVKKIANKFSHFSICQSKLSTMAPLLPI